MILKTSGEIRNASFSPLLFPPKAAAVRAPSTQPSQRSNAPPANFVPRKPNPSKTQHTPRHAARSTETARHDRELLFRLAAGAALNAAGDGAVDVVVGDPAFVVALGAVAAAGGAGRVVAGLGLGLRDRDRLARGLLAARRRHLGLREERLDPGLVDEVEGRAERAGEEEVEEDAARGRGWFVSGCFVWVCMWARNGRVKRSLHLGVKQAGGRLDDARRAAVGLDLEDLVGGRVGDDGDQLHENILRHHVEDELEGELVLLAGGDRDVVPDGRQVADDGGRGRGILGQRLGRLERATDKGHVNWRVLMVGNLDQRLGDTAVDNLDAEDVGIGKGRLNVGLELGLLDRNGGDGLGVDLERLHVSNCASTSCRSKRGCSC